MEWSASEHQLNAEVRLTLSEQTMGHPVGSAIKVRARDFIAYEQGTCGTRVRLTRRTVVMVRENTDQIDRLMHQAQTSVCAPSSSGARDQTDANQIYLSDASNQQEAA